MKKKLLITGLLAFMFTSSSQLSFAEEATNQSTDSEVTVESTVSTMASQTTQTSEEIPLELPVPETTEVENTINDVIGARVGEDVPVEKTPEVSEIRKELSNPDYGIAEDILAAYTDEQLENAMTLFTRYNYDVTGMDYGAYGRLLSTLYNDKSVVVEDALTQLYFDPSSFNSFSEMIPRVDELEVYLKILYPTNSTFIPGIERSKEQLVAKLEALQKMEDELTAKGESLGFGRIAPFLQADEEVVAPTTSTESTEEQGTTESTTTSSQQAQAVATTDSSKKNSVFPQTDEEQNNLYLVGFGLISVASLGFIVFKRP